MKLVHLFFLAKIMTAVITDIVVASITHMSSPSCSGEEWLAAFRRFVVLLILSIIRYPMELTLFCRVKSFVTRRTMELHCYDGVLDTTREGFVSSVLCFRGD